MSEYDMSEYESDHEMLQRVARNEAARLRQQRDTLAEALRRLLIDVECYCCTDGVANKEPCGHCWGRAALAAVTT